MRQLWVKIYRWAGLAMAGFLIVVGLREQRRLSAGDFFHRLDLNGV
jgi:hypothetical protein